MLERLFHLTANGTNPRREIIAGLTTFAAMSYILAINPDILSAAGMGKEGLVTVTALAAGIGTLLMALFTNYPIALAPGMGLNAYFAFTVCGAAGIPWKGALAMVFWNGIIFLLLSITGLRTKIAESVPPALKIGVQCGIGLFIAFIGLRNGGIIVKDNVTFVRLGELSNPSTLLVLTGIIVTFALVHKKVLGGIIISIFLVTMIGFEIPKGEGMVTVAPDSIWGLPSGIGETFFALDILYPITHLSEAWKVVIALLFVDLFDTIGTLIGVSRQAGLVDAQDRLPKMGRALTSDACATIVGACLGTSTTTSYIESAAGVQAGGRTGMTSITIASCFFLALFFGPIIVIIPPEATAPALVMVGVLMMQGVKNLKFDDLTSLAPAVVTMMIMPLAFSISDGLAIGFIVYFGTMLLVGKWRKVSLLTAALAILFFFFYVLNL
ncbi:MAG: Adenine permease AdeQ [Candidatus Moanabacter tarae]|uniref:Adenine permease AdeQ n=1 Tax=Candidatus Moanibacter tarae TaxID=2200854 RepID=A0A2Z4AG57_9BACT|nr:MAG: Adenine permease AdeQ [Candidatus Moanabacter tarae]